MTPQEIRAIPDPVERYQLVNAELNPPRDRQQALAAIARESVRELRSQGLSWRKIGAQLGISGPRAQQLGTDLSGFEAGVEYLEKQVRRLRAQNGGQ